MANNNIPWVVIDLGNSYIKYKSNSRKGKFRAVLEEDSSCGIKGLKNTVEYNKKFYTVGGKGSYDREFNKVKKNYMPFLLLALNEVTTSQDVNLCLLLPTSLIKFKDEYINKLKNSRHNYTINMKHISKNIKNCIVLSEGAAAYGAINSKNRNVLIIDLGNRTLNICEIEDGVPVSKTTEGIGVYDFYTIIKERLNMKYGENYTEEDIDNLVVSRNEIYTKLENLNDLLESFLYSILNKVKANNIKLGLYDCYMVGGGAELLSSLLKNTVIKVPENSQYLNVEGAFKLVGGRK